MNQKIIENNVVYRPKGHCVFKAALKYSFGDYVLKYEFETDHRVTVKDFGRWTNVHQKRIETQFYNTVFAMRLEALLEGNERLYKKLMETPTRGFFNAWVIS